MPKLIEPQRALQIVSLETTINLLVSRTLAGLLFVFAIFPAYSQDLELSQAERDWITEHPIIKVGGEYDFGPFDFVNEQGQYAGIANDLLQQVSDRTGLQFEVELDTWSSLLEKFEHGNIDLLPAIYHTPERDEVYHFTPKYHQVAEYVFARDDAGIASESDLPGKKIVSVRGFASTEALRLAYPELEFFEVETVEEAIDNVLTYKADLMLEGIATLSFTLREKSITNIHPVFLPKGSSVFDLYMASRAGMPELAAIITKALESIPERDKQAILIRWLGELRPSQIQDAGPVELTDEERAWILNNPVIRVDNELDWPPFSYNVDGMPRGFSIDFMNLLAAKVGLQVKYISGPSWSQFMDMMRSGDLDVLANATPTSERQEFLLFTSVFMHQPVAVVVDDSSLRINTLADLNNKRVAVVAGSVHQEFMEREHPQAGLVLSRDILDCLYAVVTGRADAMLSSYPGTKYQMDQHSLLGLRFAFISRNQGLLESAVAVRRDWPILKGILQKGIDALGEQETAALRQKWLGVEIAQDSEHGSLTLTAEEKDWIRDHPVIRVHNEMNWPPFNFNEDSEPRGFSIDYMNLVAARVGLQVDYVTGPSWQEFVDMLRAGELDVLANARPTEARREFMLFTSTFIDQPVAVVVDNAITGINSLEDLRGKRVAVVGGFFHQEYMERNFPGTELVLAEDVLNALYAVMEGRADATVSSFPTTKYLMDQHSLLGLRVAFIARDPELTAEAALAVRRDWPVLRDILQKGMDSLDAQEVARLRQKWLGIEREPETQGSLSKTILWLAGITLAVFLLLILLNRLSSRLAGDEAASLQTGTLRFRFLILGALSIFVATIGIIGWLAQNHIRESILRDVGNSLENVLTTTAQRLDIWVDQQSVALSRVARNPDFIRQIESLLAVSDDPDALRAMAESPRLQAVLRQDQEFLGLGFHILNRNGLKIGSSGDENVGEIHPIAKWKPELLAKVFQGESTLIPPITVTVDGSGDGLARIPSLYVAVPVRNDSGRVIAALTKSVDPGQEFSRVLQLSRVGESGESYAFDSTGTLLSTSRFEDELREIGLLEADQPSILNIQIRDPGGDMTQGFRPGSQRAEHPFTRMAKSAFATIGVTNPAMDAAGNPLLTVEKGMGGYRDYRGVPVFGAWVWDGTHGLGIASEIDVAEALSTFNTIRILSLAVLGITLVLSLGGTFFVLATGERTNRALREARDELEDRVKERTKNLKIAKEQFSVLLENLPGAVYSYRYDDQFTTTFANEYYEVMTGYPAEDFISGQAQFSDLIHPDDRRRVREDLEQSVRARKPFDQEFRITHRAGNTVWLRSRGIAIYDDDGNPESVDGTMFDMTKQKQAEIALTEAKKAADDALDELENVSSVILRWLPDGTISSMNNYGLNLFGFTEEELIGKSQFGTIIKDDNEKARGEVEAIIREIVADPEKFFQIEGQNCNKDGEEMWMTWSNNFILNDDGSIKEILAVGHDITERKMLEAKLETAMNKANAATEAKGEFLANMSHEIRTPMNAIMGLSDLALRSGLDPKQRDYLSKIHASANALLVIVNDILDFSKIEAGKLEIEQIPFLLDDVLDRLALVAPDPSQPKRLELLFRRDPQLPDVLMGDPTRLGQVLTNLVSNAIKFTEAGEVIVNLLQENRSANSVTISFSVADTGIGMNEEQQAQLFKSFSQADSTITRKFGGTGLGLAISQQLTRMMGGEIKVASSPGQGSTFTFELAMEIVEEKARVIQAGQELEKLSVLVVDDNDMAREILAEYLDSFGYHVTQARSGEDALEQLGKSQSLDLVLVDWIMPGISGLEVAAAIHQLENPPKVVLVSSRDMDNVENPDRIDEYLAKPVSPSTLLKTIMRTFDNRWGRQVDSWRRLGELDLAPIRGAKVLVVDDSEINLQIATELLQEASLEVDVALNGEEALARLEEGAYDCVLMDVQMPIMDGYTATRKIREDARFRNLPVLAMTANAMAEDKARAFECGMNDHVPKPINPRELYGALLQWIAIEKPQVARESCRATDTEPNGTSEEAGLPTDLPGIRVNEGLQRLGGNQQLYFQLLRDFIADYADYANQIQQQLDAGDVEEATMLAHKLRGTANNLSANELGEAAQDIEEQLKSRRTVSEEDINTLKVSIATLTDTVTRIEDEVKKN